MKIEEFCPIVVRISGFSILSIRGNRLMKNVKPEYKGIRENLTRSLFGVFVGKDFLTIHFFYFVKRWSKRKR